MRRTLLTEGFKSAGLLQVCKRGQVFGYVRRIRYDLEWHVRAFSDGRIESEVERPRTSIYHLLAWPYEHDSLLAQLLNKHRIPFTKTQQKPTRQPVQRSHQRTTRRTSAHRV
ncbi:MAG TPA: hypothetical protein VLV18_09805 [Terriglobales bacterium]|nr:hypothetical protein [Terriglobales bacterium]